METMKTAKTAKTMIGRGATTSPAIAPLPSCYSL